MADNLHAVDVTGPDKVDEPKIITETEEVRDDSKPAEVEAKLNTDDKTTVPGVVDNQSVSGRNKSHSSQKTQKSRTHAPTRSSHSSTGSYITRSRASVSLSEKSLNLKAKKASLLAQAAILEEKEEIERQRLQLEQKAARLDMKTQIQMIEAEQQVLDSEHQEEDFENLASEHSLADERRKRTEDWVKKPLDPLAEAFEPTHLDDHDDNHNKVDEGLSQASHADRAVGQTNSGSALQGLVRVLQMPKVELGTFDGDPIRYWTFISSFENNVGCHDVEDHAKLAQLLQACKGKAHRLIEGCAAMPQGGYQRARRLLEERFGDRYSITAAWIDRATSGPRITADTLQDFADVLLSFQQTLSAIECLGEVNQRVLLQIAERLPAYIQHRWKREVIKLRENGRVPGVDNLVRFISGAAKEGTDPVFGQLGSTRPKPQGTSRDQKGFHGATAATLNSKKEVTGPTAERGDTASTHTKPQRCRACDGECTSLFRCEKFQQMSPEDRLSLAKKNGLCYCCLCHGHTAAECRSERTCRAEGCRYRHTKFLHVDKKANPQDGATCGYTNTSAPKVVLPVVEVKVTSQSGRNAYAYALLDSGSTHTFCAKGLLDELKSEGEPTRLNLSTLSCEGERIHTATHELKLADRRGCNEIVIHQVYACPKIPVSRHCGIQQGDLDAWEHLAGIEAPGLPEGVEIGILIGQDCPEVLMPLEVRTAADRQGAPFATRTLFGWTISGPVGVNSGAAATVSTAMTCGLEEQLEKFWELEGAKLNDTMKGLSVEDQRAMSNMRSSIQKDEGHYSIAVPFREDSSLPNNKKLAEKRLAGLAKKLNGNPLLKQSYKESMQSLIQKGYAEKVPEDSTGKEGATWYIPHHPVVNPNKSKIRVVFDCAAKHQGTSLNDKVLQGPDLTNRLFGVLLRFRQFPVAISADIEAMFLQVKVPDENRDVLRFLWWPDGDTEKTPETYRMTRHLFGGTWSPSVCAFALQETARDNTEGFSHEVIDAVKKNFYVDDCLKSVPKVQDATLIVTELPKLLARGGFRLCKWVSNRKEVLHEVPESERAVGLQGLTFQALPVERALGVLWAVSSDTFTYAAKKSEQVPLTRRGLLGAVCSVFDPLGFITPFTIRGKMLIQDLTREKVGWDEPIDEQSVKRWEEWLKELEEMDQIKIDRVLEPDGFGKVARAELHHFSDASTTAYGSASYLRLISTEGRVTCNLLFTRSRVAPVKQMTIPRLELAAAAMSVQQDSMIRREMTIPIDDSTYWTDSAIVLAYIKNEKKRFHTYVANRLALIHAGSSVGQWKHVVTQENPADDLSRGLSLGSLASSRRWWHGPASLNRATDAGGDSCPEVDIEDDPEVKKSVVAYPTAVKEESSVVEKLIEKHSSWARLRRVIAWIRRFCSNLGSKARGQGRTEGQLKVRELEEADQMVVRHVQRHTYGEEIHALQDGASIKKKSAIYNLDPQLSEQGILVCGVRTKKMPGSAGKAPRVILPKSSRVSALLVRHHHETCGHMGREYTVAEVRQEYWIQGLRGLVRRVLRDCRRCRRLYSKPEKQRMGELPDVRLAKDKPPFHNVGVDCFGPFTTKLGRRQQKRYGCIFTCMTCRAVHLEVLDSMDTDSFINALVRFTSRRGNPGTISCDNGTNFVGAERVLRESMEDWDQQRLGSFMSQRGIEWRFNPPAASHMGGAWERLIRSVRKVLSAVLVQQVPSDDTLQTMMCLVEGILNGRPLTTASDDPVDLDPLTPNHLLLLRPTQLPPPGVFDQKDCYVKRRWRQVQYLADVFWRRWLREYLPWIQLRTKWIERVPNLSEGDVVLVVEPGCPRNEWRLGQVTEVMKGEDGLVRSAGLRTRSGTLVRPVTKLCYLEGSDRMAV